MYSYLLLAGALLSALGTLGISFPVLPFSMLRSMIVGRKRFAAVRALIRLFPRMFSAVMIPGVFPPETRVTILADVRLFAGMQQHVIVQRFGVVKTLLALRALVTFLAVMLAGNMIYQKLFHSVRDVTNVALVNGIHFSFVHPFLMRLQRHLMLELLVTLPAFVPRFLFDQDRILIVYLMNPDHVTLEHAIRREILHANRARE